ncbi:MAG: VOC family protein [Candidatus Eremiobacteraeota bacterium]|nr:VOC family protein [Candidatus Eremiobacteraeota bacterium]
MTLEPYIFFYGRCEEALKFYKEALGGDYELNLFDGAQTAHDVSPEYRSKVMHATFSGPGFKFMASDGPEGKTVDPDAGNISLSLACGNREETARKFAALSDGGKVSVPLADAFWGGQFGILVDKFGTEWMITAD